MNYMSAKDINKKFVEQEGKCYICARLFTTTKRRGFNIDHDHHTGMIRGLLCRTCNLGLGMFGDNRDLLKSAILYLEKFGQKL